jgi:predicted phosphodiesterase
MRLALISDIHGHLPALEAVLADIRARGADLLICLGDVVTLGLQPAETLDLLAQSRCRFVQGNHDQAVLDPRMAADLQIPEFLVPSIQWTRSKLSARQLNLIGGFEPILRIGTGGRSAAFLHASPQSNCTGIPPNASDVVIEAVLSEMAADIVGAGHTHCQMNRPLCGRLFVNPGSVGSVFKIFPGGSEEPSLQPWAEYALLDLHSTAAAVEFRRVEFPTATVRQTAEATSSPEREWWLRQYA